MGFFLSFFFSFLLNFLLPEKTFTTYGNNGDSSNKTTYKDIMPFTAGLPERINTSYYQHDFEEHEDKFYFSAKALYSKVNEEDERLANYFLPDGKSDIYVFGGDDFHKTTAKYKFKRDIDASALNILDESFFSNCRFDFSSEIKGLGFDFNYCFYKNLENKSDLCFKFFLPYLKIKHKSEIKESIKSETLNGTNSVKKSLSENIPDQIAFDFSEKGVSNSGFGNLEIGMSYRTKPCDRIYMENLFGVIFPNEDPLERKSCEKKIFYPTIGNNGHFGLQYENQITLNITEKENYSVRTILVNNSSYLFPSEQKRVFDLSHKPWSRYIPVYKNLKSPNQETNPLGKYTNLLCSVSPNFSFTSTSEIGLYKENSNLCVGYCFYSRQAESIEIKGTLPEIIFKSGDLSKNTPYINPFRSIDLRYTENDVLVDNNTIDSSFYKVSKIKTNDLDISSAGHPALLMGTLYTKIGFENENLSTDLGLSYRYCYNNAALKYFTIWGTISFSF